MPEFGVRIWKLFLPCSVSAPRKSLIALLFQYCKIGSRCAILSLGKLEFVSAKVHIHRKLLAAGISIVLALAAVIPAVGQQQPNGPLTDQDVLQMVKAGFDDTTILRYIRENDVDFDLSINAMVALKNAGVSQSLIQAMLSIEVSKKEIGIDAALAAISATASGSRDDMHVFALQAGKLIPMDAEIVNWKQQRFRNVASFGFDRGPLTARIPGPHGDLVGRWPPMNMVPVDMAFYILTPKGASASDFQLLHLTEQRRSPRIPHRPYRPRAWLGQRRAHRSVHFGKSRAARLQSHFAESERRRIWIARAHHRSPRQLALSGPHLHLPPRRITLKKRDSQTWNKLLHKELLFTWMLGREPIASDRECPPGTCPLSALADYVEAARDFAAGRK